MGHPRFHRLLSRLLSDYGMVLVLLLLGACFSHVTWDEQHPTGVEAAEQLTDRITGEFSPGSAVLVVAREHGEDAIFADSLERRLSDAGMNVLGTVKGQPSDARGRLQALSRSGAGLDAIACTDVTGRWAVFDRLGDKFPGLSGARVLTPPSYRWPNFLKRDNLLNVANQIAVIAILAVGMTMVIITAGIDLSVGSLIAFSAVVCTWLIREAASAEAAGPLDMVLCGLGAILLCGLLGAFSGVMVTWFAIPPFIATLGMMLVASGLAYILAEGQSVYQVPDSFVWLGRGADFLRIPNAVVLMLALYLSAHLLMTRTALGRYIYAVGGNREAARLSGVPVTAVLIFVYTLCAALAGLGGVVMASQLKSGSPTYGLMYELYTIAAVVVGGASLAGGEGRIFGTLIGAFIIAVIQNGMNLTGVESYTQKVVLGAVILGAVLLDIAKKRGWGRLQRASQA